MSQATLNLPDATELRDDARVIRNTAIGATKHLNAIQALVHDTDALVIEPGRRLTAICVHLDDVEESVEKLDALTTSYVQPFAMNPELTGLHSYAAKMDSWGTDLAESTRSLQVACSHVADGNVTGDEEHVFAERDPAAVDARPLRMVGQTLQSLRVTANHVYERVLGPDADRITPDEHQRDW